MADIAIHDEENPDGRPATDDEIADLISEAATADEALSLLASLEAADAVPIVGGSINLIPPT